ncbi:fumarylacetoacetate hydrolase family protein [Paenibacillus sp.]|uniref:fumarylacetoacetate hydrolase family protein n=1 Tax=Paenibacillus sp. TaxID=58172 RepID=UPI00281191D3|nr:fumarylacetoacetate hydrolase family protein [Paenibacillus sp.]
MKLVQYRLRSDAQGRIRVGEWLENGSVRSLDATDMKTLIRRFGADEQEIRQKAASGEAELSADDVRLIAPIHNPDKMIFVGLNYKDHVEESNMAMPEVPVLFPKYPNAIVGPEDDVIIPAEVRECDYEVELAVVIGREAKRVSPEQAMNYVFGYTVINDVSARDLQLREGQWTRGKAIDTFAPMGPCIATKDDVPAPHLLNLSLTLNGGVMQGSNTRELIFDIPYLISFISRTMTLQPGDIISTGTPPGVGMGRTPPVWIRDGDVTEAFVERIGLLRNRYVQERD